MQRNTMLLPKYGSARQLSGLVKIWIEMTCIVHFLVKNTNYQNSTVSLRGVEYHMPPEVVAANARNDFIKRLLVMSNLAMFALLHLQQEILRIEIFHNTTIQTLFDGRA